MRLCILFGILLLPSLGNAKDLWLAKRDCVSNFGFYNLCKSQQISLSLTGQSLSTANIPQTTRLYFSASCSRSVGKTPTISIQTGQNRIELGFSKVPALQTIDLVGSNEEDSTLEIAFDPQADFAPDCQISFHGHVTRPDLRFVETYADLLLESVSDKRRIQEQLAQSGSQGEKDIIKSLSMELNETSKRHTVACLQLTQQANRRTSKALEARSADDSQTISLLLGDAFATFVGSISVKKICDPTPQDFEGMAVSGLIGRFRNEILSAQQMKSRVDENLQSCTGSAECPGLNEIRLEEALQSSLERYTIFTATLRTQVKTMQQQILELEADLTQKAFPTWKAQLLELQSQEDTLQKVVEDGDLR